MTIPDPLEVIRADIAAMRVDITTLQADVAALQATEQQRQAGYDWLRAARRGDTDPKPGEREDRQHQ